MRRFLPAIFAILLAGGCGGSRGPVAFFDNPLPLLVWLGEFTRPSGTVYPQLPPTAKFGSVSGLAPDPVTQQWVGVIDERDHSRIAWLNVSYGPKGLDVNPTRVLELRAGPGVPETTATKADLEGIVALPDGRFIMSEEGHIDVNTKAVWQPVLLESTHDGVVTSVITYPKEFQITGDGTTGLRPNEGFEGLTMTPSGRLIAGLEQPLIQDGPTTSFERVGSGRLVEFVKSGASYKTGKQWRYIISPTPRIENFDEACSDGENGLVELLALSETTLLSMERACLQTKDHQFRANAIQLFSVELIGGDARKKLLLNFDNVQPRLSSALTRLENFEGMTFGPIVNGQKTLLIVSDDNFRQAQKTSFLLFGMR